MIGNVKEKLSSHFRYSKFAIRIDESTEITGSAVLLNVSFTYNYKAFRMLFFKDHFKPTYYRTKYFWVNTYHNMPW